MGFTTSLANAFANSYRPTDGANSYLKGQIAGAQIQANQASAASNMADAELKRARLQYMSPDALDNAAGLSAGVLPYQQPKLAEYFKTGSWGENQKFADAGNPDVPQVVQDMHPAGGIPAAQPEWFNNELARRFATTKGALMMGAADGRITGKDIADASGKFQTNLRMSDVATGAMTPEHLAALQAAEKGNDFYSINNEGAVLNKFTGGVDTRNKLFDAFLGKTNSEINENNAQAGKYRAEAYQTNQGSNMVLPQGVTPAQLMQALEGQESGGNPNAVSPKGARGVVQIMPETRAEILQKTGIDAYSSPENNRKAGEWYLGQMFTHFGDPQLALAAYNAGPGRVSQALQQDKANGGDGSFASVSRFLPPETRAYVPGVIARMGGFQQKQAKDTDAAAAKAVSMTMPDWLRDQFSVQAFDAKGKPQVDTMTGKPIIDQAATNQKLLGLTQAWEAAGRPPMAEFAARYLNGGAQQDGLSRSFAQWLPHQPAPVVAPQKAGPDHLADAKAAIAAGAPRDKVIARLRQLGVNPVGL